MISSEEAHDRSFRERKYVGWHVVAFLDLLGQQDALRGMIMPDKEKQHEVDAFKRKVRDLYAPLYALRTWLHDSIRSFIEGGIDRTQLAQPAQELLDELRGIPIFYRYFSDSIIVHIPLRDDIGRFKCRAVYGVLGATALTFLSCMSKGWALRGGIEVGLAMDIGDNEIYGPALARAHALESKVAQYPRIVIGEELIAYLKAIAGQPASTPAEEANARLATRSLEFLAVDDDGQTFLDYLGSDVRDALSMTKEKEEVVQEAYNFIIQEANRHKEDRNSKLGFRYTLLRNYFESRLPDWGLIVRST